MSNSRREVELGQAIQGQLIVEELVRDTGIDTLLREVEARDVEVDLVARDIGYIVEIDTVNVNNR